MRYLTRLLKEDLEKKMIFIGGPRQVGKTTLAKSLMGSFPGFLGQYYNWDYSEDRESLQKLRMPIDPSVLVFDEIHKYQRWKSLIKGFYDVAHEKHRFIVTGSARLDLFRQGGDSLLGRYHYWRLHPFGLDEIPDKMTSHEALQRLMNFGGFPEPFLEGDERSARRWRRERLQRVVRDDIRDMEPIRNLAAMELFLDSLRERVGGLVVLSNIANDLQVAPKTLAHWVDIFERMYLAFAVRPFTTGVPRAIQKPPKIFFFDNGDVIGDDGARFENLVATHLLKKMHFLEDSEGFDYKLHYLRDKEKREVDFVITKGKTLEALVEVKLRDSSPSVGLLHYAKKLEPRRVIQIVAKLERSYRVGNIEVVSPDEYFRNIATPF